jgi:DNA-directed RNA polymerase specialized sigma24 family protein
MQNPAGYLYRVGQHTGFRKPHRVVFPDVPHHSDPIIEPALPKAMAKLSTRQRTAVVLVHCFAWTPAEVAEFLEVSVSTVRNHLDRGMKRLRVTLGGVS